MTRDNLSATSMKKIVYCGLAVIGLISVIGAAYWSRSFAGKRTYAAQIATPMVAHASDMSSVPEISKKEMAGRDATLSARLEKSPDDPAILAEIGRMHYRMQHFGAAAEYYRESVRLKPDASIMIKLGGAYHHAGDAEKAIEAWSHALQLEPNNADALFNIGYVRWHVQGNPQAAIIAWQHLLKANPNHPKRAQVENLLAQAKQHLEQHVARSN